jgi:ATP-dependent 26S proteasome regulatory subunit
MLQLLDEHVVIANTRTHEVEEITFDKMPGAEAIVEKLETHIILPLQNLALAQELDIRPKRGVLLYGPPGTGKTSIGRALAHRMKGKFFLIDGSIATEPPGIFFAQIRAIVQEAQENARCVLFIDDADVLFGIEHISGFGRYLLTLLDGMETDTAAKVCLMMTAMDVRKVPEAILRSGRVELWLETRPPAADVRARILERWMTPDLPGYADIDFDALALRTENFTPADLRRIVGDARTYYAADKIAKRKPSAVQAYLERSIDTIVATRARMADSLHDETLRAGRTSDKPRAKYGAGIGGLAAATVSCQTKFW